MKPVISFSSLAEEASQYIQWARKNPVPKPDVGVAKEGAGSEWRAPLMHYGTVMPVYLSIARYIKALKPKKKMKLVELGCGTGRALSYLQYLFPEIKVWGTDYSSSCIQYAKKTYRKFHVTFRHNPAQKTMLPSHSFDFVISSHVIEHVSKEDGVAFLKETQRLLKKGGYAFIGTPERRHCQDLYQKNPTDTVEKRLVPPHEHEYSLEELKKLAQTVFQKEHVQIHKLQNPTFMKVFTHSIQQFQPQGTLFSSLKNSGYRFIRDHFPKNIFDQITAAGAYITLLKEKLTFYDILLDNSIESETTKSTADNLFLVCKK